MSDFMSVAGRLRFYFGAAYGSAQTALRRLEEPHVILSYETQNNRPWDGIDDLFIDSGAYSVFTRDGDYQSSAEEYAAWLADHSVDRYSLRDIPTAPKTLDATGESIATHQARTVEYHAECLAAHQDLGLDARPITVLQGGTPAEYLTNLQQHADQGTLMMDVGIGSLAFRDVADQEAIISAVYDAFNPRVTLHGFGITPRALRSATIRNILDSADSSRWSYGLYGPRIHRDERMFHVAILKFLEEKRLLHALFGLDDVEWYGADDSEVDIDVCQAVLAETNGPEVDRLGASASDRQTDRAQTTFSDLS